MKRLLCFGDSNTYGYKPVDGRWPWEIRWTGRLARLLGPDWQLIEAGQNGRSAGCYDELWPERNGAAVIGDYLRRYSPLSVLCLMLGSNDIIYAPAEQAAVDLGLLLDRLPGLLDYRRVLLIAPPAGQFSRLGYPGAGQLAPLYSRLAAERGLVFADANQWGLGMEEDGCHLSAADHAVFAAEVYKIITARFA